MRVAVALGGTDLGRSGIGRFVREVLPRMDDRLHRAGGALLAFGTRREIQAYRSVLRYADTVAIPDSGSAAGSSLWHLLCAGRRGRRLGADVLLLPAANRRAALTSPVPMVAVVHDLAQLHVERKFDALRMFYAKRILPLALRRAAVLVAVSEATRSDVARSVGPPRERIRLVPNGVDAKLFAPAAAGSVGRCGARRALAIERPCFVYPARLEAPGKNHLRLLRAFSGSPLRHSHVLVFVGSDWGARSQIERLVQTLGLGESVRILGYVSDLELSALLTESLAVLAVGLHEGFGLPALEALAAGKPVVSARSGSLPEVVGSLGVYCDPRDTASIQKALEQVAQDVELHERAAREGPAWASRFSWDATAEGLLDACTAALDA